MEVFEFIRRGYRALGLGASDEVLAMFDQVGDRPARWVIRDLNVFGGDHPADDVAAFSLFGGLPPHFELVGVNLSGWRQNRRLTRLVVSGRFRVRVRGTWEGMDLPFTHVWSFKDGCVTTVYSVLDGTELRRAAPAVACSS